MHANVRDRRRVSPGRHGARSSLDNCYEDYAVRNGKQLADLLSDTDLQVVTPQG